MKADFLVNILLEDEPDLEGEVDRYMATAPFDRGAADILRDGRELYLRLMKDNSIPVLRKERPGMDDESIAQAVLKRAIERRSSPGCNVAYRRLKALNYFNF
jgi:hypothetical protein